MKKSTLILIRHGFSEANAQNIFAGSYNIHLTEVGKKQAALTAAYLTPLHIDKIYSSDLYRAAETAAPIAESKNLVLETREDLREIFGGKWEQMPFFDLAKTYPEEFSVWMKNFAAAKCPGGESVQEMYLRAKNAVLDILGKNEGKTVCVVSHATVIRALFTYFSDKPFAEIGDVPFVPNSSVSIIEYENGKFTVIQNGYDDHLGGLATTLPTNV